MLLPARLDAILPDQAIKSLAKHSAEKGSSFENIELDQVFEQVLDQLQTMTETGGENLPAIETGNLLPFSAKEGMPLPPGLIRAEAINALENPNQVFQLLTDLQQQLRSKNPDQAEVHRLQQAVLQLTAITRQASIPEIDAESLSQVLEDSSRAMLSDHGVERPGLSTAIEHLARIKENFSPAALAGKDMPGIDLDLQRFLSIPGADIEKASINQNLLNPSANQAAVIRDSALSPLQAMYTLAQGGQSARVEGQATILSVQTPVVSPNWSQSFNSNILMIAKDQMQMAKLNLNPPELGPVEIRLSVQNDQTNIQFFSQHSSVRDVIEEAFPRLRELLASNGINLGDVNVSEHSSSNTPSQQDSSTSTVHSPVTEAAEEHPSQLVTRLSTSLVDHYI